MYVRLKNCKIVKNTKIKFNINANIFIEEKKNNSNNKQEV